MKNTKPFSKHHKKCLALKSNKIEIPCHKKHKMTIQETNYRQAIEIPINSRLKRQTRLSEKK